MCLRCLPSNPLSPPMWGIGRSRSHPVHNPCRCCRCCGCCHCCGCCCHTQCTVRLLSFSPPPPLLPPPAPPLARPPARPHPPFCSLRLFLFCSLFVERTNDRTGRLTDAPNKQPKPPDRPTDRPTDQINGYLTTVFTGCIRRLHLPAISTGYIITVLRNRCRGARGPPLEVMTGRCRLSAIASGEAASWVGRGPVRGHRIRVTSSRWSLWARGAVLSAATISCAPNRYGLDRVRGTIFSYFCCFSLVVGVPLLCVRGRA